MLMTADGSNDDLIIIDGVAKYTFVDADAGDLHANERSDHDEEEEEGEKKEEEKERRTLAFDDSDDGDHDEQEGEVAPSHLFDDDSEDDTADPEQVFSFVNPVSTHHSGWLVARSQQVSVNQ